MSRERNRSLSRHFLRFTLYSALFGEVVLGLHLQGIVLDQKAADAIAESQLNSDWAEVDLTIGEGYRQTAEGWREWCRPYPEDCWRADLNEQLAGTSQEIASSEKDEAQVKQKMAVSYLEESARVKTARNVFLVTTVIPFSVIIATGFLALRRRVFLEPVRGISQH